MAIRPSSKPEWTYGNGDPVAVEPTAGKKLIGWLVNERPPFQWLNWLFKNLSEWVDYFDENISTGMSGTRLQWDAIVGPTANGATHNTLAEALADAIVPVGANILVCANETVDTTVQVTKQNVQIEFKPGVVFNKGLANTGLQISASGVRIRGGRFTNFTTQAILIDVGSTYAMLRDIRFGGNTLEVNDLAPASSILGNVIE